MATARKKILQRIFNIYPGEEKRALFFALLGFMWAFGASCGVKFADALFILNVGAERLPQAYTLIACGMFCISFVLLYAFHHFSSYQIYLTILSIGWLFYLSIYLSLCVQKNPSAQWFWFLLKLGGFYLFALLMTSYWTFIDQYHHLQDAKRLYSLFSSMIFLGSGSTGLLMNLGVLDLDHLILLIMLLLSLTFCFVRKIKKTIPLVAHEDQEKEKPPPHEGHYLLLFLKSILSSRFTLLLMTSNLLIYLLLVITEYNYMFTFENYFAAQKQSSLPGEGTEALLTRFLGQNLAIASIGNLLFGLFAYSRLVRRFGIGKLLFITPTLLLFAFSGWTLSSQLLFPLIGFFVVEGTLYVIDDSNFNLLLNAVPSKLKYKIRVLIESFFEPFGVLISALLLSFFQRESKLLGLALSLLAFCVAAALSTTYLKALFFNLSANAIHFRRSLFDWIGKIKKKQYKVSENRLFSIFTLGNEEAELFAFEGLLAMQDPSILRRLLSHATLAAPSTKVKLIHLLEKSTFAKEPLVIDCLQAWLEKEFDKELQGTLYFYLAKLGLLHPEKMIHELENHDLYLRGAAIISLKKSLATLEPQVTSNYRTLATQQLQLLLSSSSAEEICMGLHILGIEGESQEIDILISHLRHPNPSVVKAAALALAHHAPFIDSIRQAPLIIEQISVISENETRLACLSALKKVNDSSLILKIIQTSLHFRPSERRGVEEVIFHMGLRAVPALLSATKDKKIPDRSRLLAGRILGRLAPSQLRANLSDIISQEIERAYFYFYHHQTIQSLYPNLDLSILQDVLITGYESVLDFIIQLLGIAGEVEDEELLSRSLRSPNPKVRSQVVETIEKSCEPKIFRLLQPLVDDIPDGEKMRACLKWVHPSSSLEDLLDHMAHSSAGVDRIMAAAMKHHLNLPSWRESLRQQMASPDEIFHRFAYELLDS